MSELIITERSNLTAIADAVRGKTGTTASMTLGGIVNSIQNIETNPTLQNKTVTPTTSVQTVSADSGYDGLSNVTVNAIPSTYVKPTATKAATTYTPTTANQTIASGTYCSGAQTIKGDSNLVAANIKSGVSIFGVTGSCVSTEFCNLIFRNYWGNSVSVYVSGDESTVRNSWLVSYNKEVTIQNVPRYSYIIVQLPSSVSADVSTVGATKRFLSGKIYVFYATVENGATATIEIS